MFYEWWAGLSFKLRGTVAMFIMLIGALLWRTETLMWYQPIVIFGVGLILLLFSFPTAGEKKGYHDF